jgi:hypothetical protein
MKETFYVLSTHCPAMQALEPMNIVKKCCWNHSYDRRVNIPPVPVLRLHSAEVQPVPLKKMIMFRAGQIHRQNSGQNHSGHCHLAFRRV